MKIVLIFPLALFLYTLSYAQSLDASITTIATDIAQKVSKKNKIKLALTDFVNSEGKRDALTDYIRNELELKLINADNLEVIDRKHLQLLLSEYKLQSDGLINERVAKSAIEFIKVDGWVTAEITSLADQIKIKVTVIDVGSSVMYAASSSNLISDIAIKNLLEPEAKICPECGGRGTVQLQTNCTACEGSGGRACSDCRGTGKRSGMTVGSYIICEACNGRGKFSCNVCSGKGKILSYQTCPKCHGKVQIKAGSTTPGEIQVGRPGKIEICPECMGNGKLKSDATCNSCNGSGEAPFGPGSNWEKRPCKTCSGKGTKTVLSVCTRCNGTGKL
ncbi:MAG: CsgG/HfaB family protein [Bacteroidota bacterium]